MKRNVLGWLMFSLALGGCGAEPAHETSSGSEVLQGGGWSPAQSPYNLPPFSTISVCDTGVKAGVKQHVTNAVHTWLKVGGRDGLIRVIDSCSQGDRIIKLVRVSNSVDYYGQVAPLRGNVYTVSVPDKWAGHWTANHEVGHIFGFAHIFSGTVSIMNSEDNGRYMNGGELSAYDYSEVRRLLASATFQQNNRKWISALNRSTTTEPTPMTRTRVNESDGSCLGADGVTVYADATVTTYQGNTYTCSRGSWIFSAGIR